MIKQLSITLLLFAVYTGYAAEPLSLDNVSRDSRLLSSLPNRLTGTKSHRQAGDYIVSELQKLDRDHVSVQRFEAPLEDVQVCELRTGKATIKLQPFKANGICTSSLRKLDAPVKYLENLGEDQLRGVELDGCIAVVPVTEKDALVKLFRRGVKAVIFIGSPDAEAKDFLAKVSEKTFDLPRFYMSELDARKSGVTQLNRATIESRIVWQRTTGRNIFLLIEGDGQVFENDKPELVILSASYDSFGYIPRDASAMDGAANCAVLLETARKLSRAKSKRSVLIAFFDAHANYHQGARTFYTALRRSFPERLEDPFEVRKTYLKQERALLEDMAKLMSDSRTLLSGEGVAAGKARERCWTHAKYSFGKLQQSISKARLKIRDLQSRDLSTETEQAKLNRDLETQKSWQAMLQTMRYLKSSKEAETAMTETLTYCRENIGKRLQELVLLETFLQDGEELTAAIDSHVIVGHMAYQLRCGYDRWLVATKASMRPKVKKEWLQTVKTQFPEEADSFVWDVANGRSCHAHIADTCSAIDFAVPFRIPAAKFLTVEDFGRHAGVPGRKLSGAEINNVYKQGCGILPFLQVVLNDAMFSSPEQITRERKILIEDYQWVDNEAVGHKVLSVAFGETAPTQNEPGAVVHVATTQDSSLAKSFVCFADANACFPVRTIDPAEWRYMNITGGQLNADGTLNAINCYTPSGSMASVQTSWTNVGSFAAKHTRGFYTILCLFRGAGGEIAGTNLPFSEAFKPGTFKVLNGLSNSTYKYLHFDMCPRIGIGAYWVEEPYGVKFIYENPKNASEVALLVNSSKKDIYGIGYGPGAGDELSVAAKDGQVLDLNYHAAADIYTLNESRLQVLRKKNIVRNDLEVIHSNAKQLHRQYEKAVETGRYTEALATANLVSILEQKIYRPIISMTNDMVVAVTILLLMALPFAFAVQSLLLPTFDIYGKIIRFIIIFLCSFATLYLVHPAFSFASMPVVILIAFVIIVLSGMVIWLIGNKFSYEVKKLQGMATAAHTFESKAIGNLGAAISLAISTMRRRPVRTLLTVVTVLLLTYTILSFASFQTEKGVNDFYLGGGDQCSRVLIRRKVWRDMDQHNLDEYKSYIGNRFALHGRYWKTLELAKISQQDELQVPIYTQPGAIAMANSIMTVDELELEKIPALRDVFTGKVDDFIKGKGVFLAISFLEKAGIKVGDRVRIQGLDVEVLGSFDAQKLMDLTQIDDSPLLPIDFNITQQALGQFEAKGSAGVSSSAMDDLMSELEALGTEALEPVSADTVVVAPTALHEQLGLTLKAVVAYPKVECNLGKVGHDLALVNDAGVYVNNAGERSFFHFGDKMGVGGLSDVTVPLILGGLIIFSTMLGSIIDREKEIYTFSALGLSPKSIAMLFFVESGIYAIIGGFGGYLLSQVITRGLEVMATYGLFQAPEMNYSSTTAINTILLVMATVIISTIYPATQAAKKATADTSSSWKIPEPDGDVCAFDFPFTISQYDISGVICFLNEHFSAYADRTIGEFAVDNIDIYQEAEDKMLAIRADIWLQPFDEGISQHFELTAHPSDIPEVCEIHVKVTRLSGPPGSWRRSNILFMKDLRRQFLLWRTLDDELMDHYLTVADGVEERFQLVPQT